MNSVRRPAVQNLSAWLESTTGDLVPSAQARVRPEIEAHYAEAVQSQLSRGAAEPVARVAALADLGEPRAAARRFRRQYLTVKEAREVTHWLKANRGPAQLMFLGFYFEGFRFLLAGPGWKTSDLPARFCLAAVLGLFLIYAGTNLATLVLARRPATLKTRRWIFLSTAINWWNWGMLNLIWCYVDESNGRYDHGWPFFINVILPVVTTIMLVLTGYMGLHYLRLRKKIATLGDHDFDPV